MRSRLLKLFSIPLPGEQAHIEFLPMRSVTSEALSAGVSFRESAVALILFMEQDQLCTLVIQRSDYITPTGEIGKHSGQISFPGGKKEFSDINEIDTSKRECFEEIGIVLSTDHYIGKLSQVYVPVSGFLIDVCVFYLPSLPSLKLDEREVKSTHILNLNALFQTNSLVSMDIEIAPGRILQKVSHFVQNNVFIWGATALILNELKWHMRHLENID